MQDYSGKSREDLIAELEVMRNRLEDLRRSARESADIHRRDAELYRMLVETMPEGLAIQDAEGRIIYVNDALCRIAGLPRDQLLGKKAIEGVAPEQRDRFAGEMKKRKEGEHAPYELTWLSPSGRRIETVVSPAPVFDEEGKFKGAFAVITDITEKKHAEEALRESEDRFRQILETSRDIAYKYSIRDECWEYVSPSVRDLLGLQPEEVILLGSRGMTDRMHPDDRFQNIEYHRTLIDCARNSETPPLCEFRMRHEAGGYRWFSEAASLILDENGNPVARIGTLREITESRITREAVETAARMESISTMAGGIAHDFNNLMTGVLGNAELLELKLPRNEMTQRMLNAIIEAAERGGELAQQMLAFARGGKYHPRHIELNEVIASQLDFEHHVLPPGISIDINTSGDLWAVWADPDQMGQVAMQLIQNAVEAIEKKGLVTVTTQNLEYDGTTDDFPPGMDPGFWVLLRVSDTGQGMTEEVRGRVFEPFFSTRFQGRGLGLAAVYGIVKNHRGHITVESSPGKGSTFSVYLPASREGTSYRAAGESVLPVGHETILIADDEDMVLNATRHSLEQLGYRVLIAKNGREALHTIRDHKEPVHLAILDMVMPVMDGVEVFPHLRETAPDMKIILCSGYQADERTQALLEQGAECFLPKPFRIHTLANRLRSILDA